MKKNVIMRVAAVLLVAVILTTCAISGTFAKYISTTSADDNARVAIWRWGSTSISLDLFDDIYDESVDSIDGSNVVAPGTSKEYTVSFNSAKGFDPEVDYEIDYEVVANCDAGLEEQLVWYLDGTEYDDIDELATAIEDLKVAKVDVSDDNADAYSKTFTIGWTWAFEDGSDEADTALGNAATLDTCSIEITLTATQLN